MLVYKLLFWDTQTALRSDLSFFLRSAAGNLPDWLVEWYKEGVYFCGHCQTSTYILVCKRYK